ncbi:daptide-type RiPP biosynthesis dehydogenase [Streptomyces nitrosporeus]|uniref:Iron-containing alcohol dehydrogenase n=1 Tax=Streptomyces nitrosporeus TaxID=28894 RepID=A0A5J6FBR7_9ACTN|nr:daptide-type RiPP biosynthesis dehydogenase [Streptomyces nitrosporeus]QEU73712.1 iron-containing alcohol dehydrogenase [Streptomyces nitrosporeus]GGZ11929.1 aldehyde reductase [Streptomyces nitrosporeus]
MNIAWSGSTRLLVGSAGLADWLEDFEDARGDSGPAGTALLLDPAVAESSVTALVTEELDRAGHTVRRIVPDGDGGPDEILALAGATADAGLIAAVGGGSLIDRAKLLAVAHEDPRARAALRTTGRSGLLTLDPRTRRSRPLLAVPTTIGTGAELSRVACLPHNSGKRLVMSDALAPDAALLDPSATETLPADLLVEGVLEALFRTIGPYIGNLLDRPVEDALSEAAATQLVRLGGEAARQLAAGRMPGAELRTDLARLSGLTQSTWFSYGRDLFSTEGWMIANELSSALGARKMTAVAALLPSLWQAVLAGDTRLGSAPRLRRVWDLLRSADSSGDPLPAEPAAGISALMDRWGVARDLTLTPPLRETVARRTVRTWGAGLPMLGGLRAADVNALLTAAA